MEILGKESNVRTYTRRFKPGQITANVTGEIKEIKHKLGVGWTGLIIRGIRSMTTPNNNTEQSEKIGRMVQKISELSMRCHELEKEGKE